MGDEYSYYREEMNQVRREIAAACQECLVGAVGAKRGIQIPVRTNTLRANRDRVYVIVPVPDDTVLRNALAEHLAGYEITWFEEWIERGEIIYFSLDIGYWRVQMAIDDMHGSRWQRWRNRLYGWLRSEIVAAMDDPEMYPLFQDDDWNAAAPKGIA